MNQLSVMIVDDEESVRLGLEIVINAEEDMYVLDTAVNGLAALQKVKHQQPDILLLDIKMPVMDGLECIRRLREQFPSLAILILTTFNELDFIVRGLALGARGYLIKGKEMQNFTQHIRDVYHNRFVLPAQVAAKISDHLLRSAELRPIRSAAEFHFPPSMFAKKEQELLLLLQTELSLIEISQRLAISEGTMRNYMTRIYKKMDVKNRQEAQLALQRFVIQPATGVQPTAES